MRFVPIKTAEQQATALLHRGREQLVRQRTMLVNALRAHLAEFGLVSAQGLRNVGELIVIVRDDDHTRVPDMARQVLQVLAHQIEQIGAVAGLERQLLAWHKTNPVSQRLASIPGIGPIIATAIATSSPPGWAWCRGRIQPAATAAGRHHEARQPLFAPAAHQWSKRQPAAI
jgi:transposase